MRLENSRFRPAGFHGFQDSGFKLDSPAGAATEEGKALVAQAKNNESKTIRTWELSYRFHLHQHPYVQPLIKRLIEKGTSGLQSADTEYAEGEESLPYGVDVELTGEVLSSFPAGSRFAWKGKEIKLAQPANGVLGQGVRATLVEQVVPTPFSRDTLKVEGCRRAVLACDAKVTVASVIRATMPNSTFTIPAGSEVILYAGVEIDINGPTELIVIKRRIQPGSDLYADSFDATYAPNPGDGYPLVQRPFPVKDLDFSSHGAYAAYNWEVFFHVPFTIAIHLSKNQRFAEAQHWFHYVFDPTDDSNGSAPERFWKFRPFQTTDVEKIDEILVNLATGDDAALRDQTAHSIEAWGKAPFRPHVIARYRQQSYMYKTVMAYLDNLIAWGDSLFRQDTGEAIDEAQMLYVLAANILGPKPQQVPRKESVRPQNYANLRRDLSLFGTVMREIEADLPFDSMPFPRTASADNAQLSTVRSLGQTLYFCVPRNEKLLSYWDTVADRLFKIRNSLNIQGAFRQLALFEPPIDPAMLARAAAAGLDVAAIVNGINQPLPLVRFTFLVQKAAEIVQEVKSLGNGLLAAMEKEDGEAMALLRAKHERVVMEMVEHVKYGQLQEAKKSREGLLKSLALTVQRYMYYELQLGKKSDEIEKSIPDLEALNRKDFDAMTGVISEPDFEYRPIEVDIICGIVDKAIGVLSGGKILSKNEALEAAFLELAQISSDVGNIQTVLSSIASIVPQFTVSAHPWGFGGDTSFGGQNIAAAISAGASVARGVSERLNFEARRASRIDSFARRERDWAFQSNLAAGEVAQTFKQIRAAEIREAIAEQELKNHQQQMRHAEEIERFLNEEGTEKSGKKTNRSLYAWMKREVKGLYAQCFQFAFDVAKKAERALQHELGAPELSYIQYGYLSGKEGLLAGEKLYLDIKRMEMAYHEQNRREYELTKQISVLQVAPLELVKLRATGACTIRLPESLFDMDGPGHYFRRIRTVSLSIPCVTGPYVAVNCTLTLLKSSIRKTPAGEDYARVDAEDGRFSDNFSSLQSIVASSCQNDSGLFETNLRDERYLPFENAGVISEWSLQLPANPNKGFALFDYNTISDVIFNLRFTAREGGAALRASALEYVKELISEGRAAGSVRLFSVRHEFPDEWIRFKGANSVDDGKFEIVLNLRPEHYPFWSRDRISRATSIVVKARGTAVGTVLINGRSLEPDEGNPPSFNFPDDDLPPPIGQLKLTLDSKVLEDLWICITWAE